MSRKEVLFVEVTLPGVTVLAVVKVQLAVNKRNKVIDYYNRD